MKEPIPQHIAVVMDGNGRWALQKGLLRIEGHKAGVDAVKTLVKSCLTHHIPILSLFAFSSENWARPQTEVECLMQLFMESLHKEIKELDEQGVQVRFIGYRQALSQALQQDMDKAQQMTASNSKLILNILLNYGGKWDIVQAAQELAKEVCAGNLLPEAITEETFNRYLSTDNLPPPDLFIRTSGEQRISNFFLWQLAYTELYFTDTLWPDFDAKAFNQALMSYKQRHRRYGQTNTAEALPNV